MSRDTFTQVLASLAAAISLLERGGKKAAASDQMFEQMLDDYRAALEAGRDALSQQTEHQTIRLPARKAVPKLEDEDGGRRTDIYTQRVMVAKAWNTALDVVAELNAAPIAQKVNNVDTPEQQERWQVRYLPGQKVEERWWQDSTAERAAWCAEANAEQLAKGLPDVWEIRKFYTTPQPQPEQSGLVDTDSEKLRGLVQRYINLFADVPLAGEAKLLDAESRATLSAQGVDHD